MSLSCRSHSHVKRAVRNAGDAERALLMATDEGVDDCVVVACLDAKREPLTMFVFDGASMQDDDLELAVEAVIASAATPESPLAALFLGSSRKRAEKGPTQVDERRWVRMADRCADAGIELLDWLLIQRDALWPGCSVCSVADGLVPGPGW